MTILHIKVVKDLQDKIRKCSKESTPLALNYSEGYSNTTRSKSYKKGCKPLDCGNLNRIVKVDVEKKIAYVQPRVTIDALVKACLPFGLIPEIVPEFKGITVGGAIMGMSAESSSHKFGCFNDSCNAFEVIIGDGSLLRVTPDIHSDIFYGIAGSYGSLGLLVLAEVRLVRISKSIHLRTTTYKDPMQAVSKLIALIEADEPPFFMDGCILAKDHAVIVEGNFSDVAPDTSRGSKWYYQHLKEKSKKECIFEEHMSIYDYVFRYDHGAFWMGAYLFKPSLLVKFFTQGVFKKAKSRLNYFDKREIAKYSLIKDPNRFLRFASKKFMSSQDLWALLHQAEDWVQDRFVIQDFCLPAETCACFLEEVLSRSEIFPLWLCPIKGTYNPQLFAPHLLNGRHTNHFINVGVYGVPGLSKSIALLTHELEEKTKRLGGRKVLYSRSSYTEEEFWKIYPKSQYEELRLKTYSHGLWKTITEKVLSL